MEPATKPFILYAEDDTDDFEALQDALSQETSNYTLVQAKNGLEMIAYLENKETSLPQLIVLDLNMPLMDGKEALQWLKSSEPFRHIPVMIFTTSSRDEDIRLCKMHECTFFRKPNLYRDLLHIVQIMLQISEKQRSNT